MGGGGGSKQPKIPLGCEFGRGVKFHIYFLEGGGGGSGQPGNPSGYTLGTGHYTIGLY